MLAGLEGDLLKALEGQEGGVVFESGSIAFRLPRGIEHELLFVFSNYPAQREDPKNVRPRLPLLDLVGLAQVCHPQCEDTYFKSA